jgi:hypothetical protein
MTLWRHVCPWCGEVYPDTQRSSTHCRRGATSISLDRWEEGDDDATVQEDDEA